MELLLCCAVLAIMASMLLPAYRRALAQSLTLRCRNHLHQLGLATDLYSEDNCGVLPHKDDGDTKPPHHIRWNNVLDVEPYNVPPYEGGHKSRDGYDLKMNSRIEDYKGSKSYYSPVFRHVDSVRQPEITPLYFDGRVDTKYHRERPFGFFNAVDPRHDGEAMILFMDYGARPIWGVPDLDGGWKDAGELTWDPDAELNDQLP